MIDSNLPESRRRFGKEMNRVSEFDPDKLKDSDRKKYELIKHQSSVETKQLDSENERYREKRISEKLALLKEDAARNLDPEDETALREQAENAVRKEEAQRRQEVQAPYLQAERELLDRVLGTNRYPQRRRR